MIKKSISREITRNSVKQVVIDAGMHRLLKVKASEVGQSVKGLLESYLAELLEVKGEHNGNN